MSCPWHWADTLLNVFLAIAVDNLGNAQALTAAEERAELSEQVGLSQSSRIRLPEFFLEIPNQ